MMITKSLIFSHIQPLLLFFVLWINRNVDGAKFSTKGPVLTVTLKDPYSSNSVDDNSAPLAASPVQADDPSEQPNEEVKSKRRWVRIPFLKRKDSPSMIEQLTGFSTLSPACLWSIETVDAPLPDILPSLRKVGLTLGYRYEELKRLPCFLEGDVRLSLMSGNRDDDLESRADGLLQVQLRPVYFVAQNVLNCAMRIMGRDNGNSRYALAKFHVAGGASKKSRLELLRASYDFLLPFASVGSVSLTPSHDFLKGETSCTIVGKSGSGRTAAVVDLNWDNPTLSVVHALDRRNTISPEISLYNAQIRYNWNMALGDSGSIKTSVDPTSAIQITWTDRSMNGKWVTDFRLPLTNAMNDGRPLTTDIRVRRQFMF